MKYLYKLFISLKEIFIVMLVQYFVLFLCFITFNVEKFILLTSVLLMIFQLSYIIWRYNKNKNILKQKNAISIYLPYLIFGAGIATLYNMIIFKLELGNEVNISIPIIMNIICSGIIGPIFEELLFRYDFIKRLEKFISNKVILTILSGVIFGLLHNGIITIIYATIIGTINSYIYIKDKNINKCIILHMGGNILVNFLNKYNLFMLIISIILIIISTIAIKKEK